ncbi:hypothetical protein GNI_139130 [Gregarina niphandrodes]|uniref:Uncharacterized protein n=1 Tax=Gregarina niphandrodes TaxID=110365 RepID=A0A023B0N4_GRENI|nr:hypothetical protein GNI_139130 [Gregarina niphandrodes]EZG45345.1 hypothetical protein GNI_139130 [Gregarina niphandrodes]|eukprot:XP_011132518.1 hypothetical protein GNI_139130 [Gregarina niphandrodes]
MGTGFPGLNEDGYRTFKTVLARIVGKGSASVAVDAVTTDSFALDTDPAKGGPDFPRYLKFEFLVAFVVHILRPTLVQGNKIYGRKFKDVKRPSVSASSADSQMPYLRHHSTVSGGAMLSYENEGALGGALPIIFHDFTACSLCNARAVYLKDSKPLVHQSSDVEAASLDNVTKQKPTTLSVLDCVVESQPTSGNDS